MDVAMMVCTRASSYTHLTFVDKLKLQGGEVLRKHAPEKNKSSWINAHNVFWMVSAMAVFYYTDFYMALRYDPRVVKHYLYPGLCCLGASMSIALYLIGYYHYYLGIADYENHSPYAVPLSTILFFIAMLCLCVALWPVWSVLTPFILFTLFMGTIFLFTIIPV